jgi:predicted transcriptional regulator
MRLALSRDLRQRRVDGSLSQSDLATRMGSSQSRIAKMEAADSSVSLDLLIRSLLVLGASTRDIARALGR